MKNILLILAIIALVVLPLLYHRAPAAGEDLFAGADDKAATAVATISPEYIPWAKPLFEPPSGEIASMLFALQAAIGAGVIGYFFGRARTLSVMKSLAAAST